MLGCLCAVLVTVRINTESLDVEEDVDMALYVGPMSTASAIAVNDLVHGTSEDAYSLLYTDVLVAKAPAQNTWPLLALE